MAPFSQVLEPPQISGRFTRLIPSLPIYGESRSGLKAELKVLKILELGLPSTYTLFHSVGWSLVPKSSDVRGEADIVAVNQAGDILLIEVKSGSVDFSADGIFKDYDGDRVSVLSQIARTHGAFKKRLKDGGLTSKIASILVLPDARIVSETVQWYGVVGPAGIPPEIVRRLSETLATVLKAPDLRDKLSVEAVEPMLMSPEQFGRYIAEDVARWSRLAQSRGIQLDG